MPASCFPYLQKGRRPAKHNTHQQHSCRTAHKPTVFYTIFNFHTDKEHVCTNLGLAQLTFDLRSSSMVAKISCNSSAKKRASSPLFTISFDPTLTSLSLKKLEKNLATFCNRPLQSHAACQVQAFIDDFWLDGLCWPKVNWACTACVFAKATMSPGHFTHEELI